MEPIEEPSMDQALLNKIKETVLENLDNEQFSVEELSKNVGVSRSQLHRKLKLLKGKSVSQFIRDIRLEEAMKLLQKEVATSSEIAYRVGFSSTSYFNTCFQSKYGFPPGEVKKLKKEEVQRNNAIEPAKSKRPTIQKTVMLAILGLAIIIPVLLFFFISLSNKTNERPTSVAILPLDNLTGDADLEYMAMGMQDALIGELGKIGRLRVISKTSTLRYRDQKFFMKDIARELNVDVLVEGSIFASGDSLRLQLQLIDPFPEENHLWAQEYYQDIRQVLAMQNTVIRDIARKIEINLSPEEEARLAGTRTVNPDTYKNYLRGMYHLNKGTTEDFEKGMYYLNLAIESDPADPFAYAGLALGYAITGHGPLQQEEAMKRAKAAAQKAVSLDENMDNAYTALAMMNLYQFWDWDSARTFFEHALKINPNNEMTHSHYAWLHHVLDNGEEAIREARLAAEIDPLSPTFANNVGWIHMRLKDYDQAIAEAKKSLKLDPDFPYGHFVIGYSYLFQGKYEEAIREHQQLPQNDDFFKATLSITYAYAGQSEKATALLDALESKSKETWVHPLILARLHAALGNKEEALRYLEEASDKKYYPLPWMKYVQLFEPLKNEPRFQTIFKKWNVPS